MGYFLYVYSPSDFVGGLPDEQSAAAAGSPTFVLTLNPSATPTLIEVTDNESVFDEVDSTQSLTNAVNIDGTSYAAGTTINTAYDLLNTFNGHKVTSFHFGGDGYQQGPVDGIVSTVPLVAGQSYRFNVERTSHQQNNQYDDYIACFVHGTHIATPKGECRIEDLEVGDLVNTVDNGAQAIKWIGKRRTFAERSLAPIEFAPGAIGNIRALRVSPQHRMLVKSEELIALFGAQEALVPAKFFVNDHSILQKTGMWVTYYHLLFEDHEIIWAEGVPSEALLATDTGLGGLARDAREEVLRLFPELATMSQQAARVCLKRYEAEIALGDRGHSLQ